MSERILSVVPIARASALGNTGFSPGCHRSFSLCTSFWPGIQLSPLSLLWSRDPPGSQTLLVTFSPIAFAAWAAWLAGDTVSGGPLFNSALQMPSGSCHGVPDIPGHCPLCETEMPMTAVARPVCSPFTEELGTTTAQRVSEPCDLYKGHAQLFSHAT